MISSQTRIRSVHKLNKFKPLVGLSLALSIALPLGTYLSEAVLAQGDAQLVKADKPSKSAADRSKDQESSKNEDKDQSSSDDTAKGSSSPLSNQPAAEPLSDVGQQPSPASEDPVEQSVAGAPISAQANQGLEHYDLGRFYFSHWQLPLAEVEYEVSIMYAPGLKIAHRDYCLVSLLRGHPLRALAEMMMVVGLGDPIPLDEPERHALILNASKAHYRKALVYARASDWNNAISELQWSLSYTPDKPAVVRSLAFCYASQGDFSRAEQEYNKTFALDPDDAFSHADFAVLLAAHGQTGKAEGQLEDAIKVAPKVAALHVDLGWLAEGKGDLPTAQSELRQAIKLCPKQPGLWLQLGKVLERSGKPTEAIDAYRQVLTLDSSEDQARQRLQALKAGKDVGPPTDAQKQATHQS